MIRFRFHERWLPLNPIPLRTKLVLLAALLAIVGQEIRWQLNKPSEIDYRMEAACATPRKEAELTLMLIFNNKLVCWRFT